jgi:hypothetical protein
MGRKIILIGGLLSLRTGKIFMEDLFKNLVSGIQGTTNMRTEKFFLIYPE